MGVFDFLTNAFTGNPTQQAAQQSTAQGNALAANTQAQGTALNQNTQGFLSGIGPQYAQYIAQTQPQVAGAYGAASAAYDPLANLSGQYGQGASAYADAYGLNGPEGINRSRTAFNASPFGTALSLGDKSILANNNVGGRGVGGNTLTALQNYNANQYGNYVQGLAPYNQYQLSAAGTAAGGRAGAATGYGGFLSNVLNQQGGLLGATISPYAAGNANLSNLIGGSNANLASLTQNALAGGSAAQQQGSSNFWNTLLGGGNLAANIIKPAPTVNFNQANVPSGQR